MSTMLDGARVYALRAIHYHGGVHVIHKGGKGSVVHKIGASVYVRWDWTGETYPVDAGLLGRIQS